MNTHQEEKALIGYGTHFQGSGIHQWNSGLQITQMFVNGYFMFLFQLTPLTSSSGRHTSLSENSNFGTELKFDSQLANPISKDYGGMTSQVNRVLMWIFGPRRDDVTGEWRRIHNEDLTDLYSSPSIVRVIKWRRMRWAGHVARMGEEVGE